MRDLLGGRLRRGTGAPVAADTELRCEQEFLRETDLLCDLSAADKRRLERRVRTVRVRAGEVVYRQDDRAQELYLLKAGRVRLIRATAAGRSLELAVLEPGTFFGEMPLLGLRRRSASAEALADSVLCLLSEADLVRLVLDRPLVALRMLAIQSARLVGCETRLEEMAYRTVAARVASALLQLERDGVVEGRTHQDLADLVGAYRESVTKALSELEAAGAVELGRRRITVLNREGLERTLGS